MNSPTSQRWMIRLQQTATFVFLIYVLTLLGRSAWSNAQSNRKMEKLRTEISELKHENDYLKNLEIYVQTESFRELEARQKLGLKNQVKS